MTNNKYTTKEIVPNSYTSDIANIQTKLFLHEQTKYILYVFGNSMEEIQEHLKNIRFRITSLNTKYIYKWSFIKTFNTLYVGDFICHCMQSE